MDRTKISSLFSCRKTKYVKTVYKNFCKTTTLHGFLEMYKAKSKLWVIFWISVVTGSIIVTGHQVYQAVDQYNNQGTLAFIQPASKSQMFYPPLKYCLTSWMYWIDWDKADRLGISKSTVLYSLAFNLIVFSSEKFDIKKAKEDLASVMKENNITLLVQFYALIAKPVDRVIVAGGNSQHDDIKTLFTEIDFLSLDEFSGLIICYIAPSEKILQYFSKKNASVENQREEIKNILELEMLPYEKLINRERITKEEFTKFVISWISNQNRYYFFEPVNDFWTSDVNFKLDYSNVTIPSQLYINGFNQIRTPGDYDVNDAILFYDDIDSFSVNVKASAHIYGNTPRFQCIEDQTFIVENDTCQFFCQNVNMTVHMMKRELWNKELKEYCFTHFNTTMSAKYTVPLFNLFDIDTPLKRLQVESHIMFLDVAAKLGEQDTKQATSTTCYSTQKVIDTCVGIPDSDHNATLKDIISRVENQMRSLHKDCCSYCIPGCSQWIFEYAVSTSSVLSSLKGVARKTVGSSLNIKYPAHDETLITIETEMQSWETFVGNVGGLLGIWTGASVLTIFQLVYLCCFADSKCLTKCNKDM